MHGVVLYFNIDGVILTPQFLLCGMQVWNIKGPGGVGIRGTGANCILYRICTYMDINFYRLHIHTKRSPYVASFGVVSRTEPKSTQSSLVPAPEVEQGIEHDHEESEEDADKADDDQVPGDVDELGDELGDEDEDDGEANEDEGPVLQT